MSKKEISDPNYTKVTHGQTMIGHRELAQGMPFEDKSVFSVLKGSKPRLIHLFRTLHSAMPDQTVQI